MKKIIFTTTLSAMLALGAAQAGLAGAPGGHGGMSGGGASRGLSTSRPAAPPPASSGRVASPSTGTAVPRPAGPPHRPSYDGRPHLGTYGFYGGVLSLGLTGYYDPLWYGADPYGYLDADGAYASGGYPYGAVPYATASGQAAGGLRLQIEPKTASVFIDGYYVGVVDDFDGHFQHVNLAPGPHHVDVREPGHKALRFDVNIEPSHTITYRGELQTQPAG